MMKTPLLFLILTSVCSCTGNAVQERKQHQSESITKVDKEDLLSWLSSLPDRKKHYTSVFAVTPNDCNSCMELFTQVLRYQLANPLPENRICVVFQGVRPVERKGIVESAFQDADTANVPIIWSDKLFEQAHELAPSVKGGSVLLVFDRENKLLFSKAGKSVTGKEPELKNIFR